MLTDIGPAVDPILLAGRLGGRSAPVAVLFSGGDPTLPDQRWAWVAGPPEARLVVQGSVHGTTVREQFRGRAARIVSGDPLDRLRGYLGGDRTTVPFGGGVIAATSYEFGARRDGIAVAAHHGGAAAARPELLAIAPRWLVVIDRLEGRSLLATQAAAPRGLARRLAAAVAAMPSPPPPAAPAPRRFAASALASGDYTAAFARIQAWIRAGDCYQVNLARHCHAPAPSGLADAARAGAVGTGAPFGAWLRFPGIEVVSLSPERMLAVRDRRVLCEPIKGTAARAADPAADQERVRQLLASAKNQAENVMIVDLVRNDLGRVAIPGSVRVPHLHRLMTLPYAHHLVSTVTAELAPGHDALDAFAALFPSGSITGAPKHRAMQIIHTLEPVPRGFYCGSIGWFDHGGDADCSVAIRTFEEFAGDVHCRAGGGIVADSCVDEESEEVRIKLRPMLQLLGATGDDPV